MKKTLSILLSVLLVLAVFPWVGVAAFAEDDPSGIAWSYDEATKTLSFTGAGAMQDFVSNGYGGGMIPETPWFAYADEAEAVVIGEGITSVGAFSFTTFSKLRQVTLPSTVASIGEGAFAYCFELAEINLPDGLTGIGSMAFSANSLTNVVIPAGVTALNNVFSYNFAPLSVTLPEGLTSVVNSFNYDAIENLTIPSTVTQFIASDGDSLCLLNVKNLVNNSADAAVSGYLGSINEEFLNDYLRFEKLEYSMEISYLRTGEYPDEESMQDFYLLYYNSILGTNFASYTEMIAAYENGEFTEEQLARLNSIGEAMDVKEVPLSSIRIYCLQDSAEHDALRKSGYPHYIIDNGGALCEEPLSMKCGDNLFWTIEDGALVISGSGEMYDNYKGWLFRKDEISSIRFVEEGGAITYIGNYSFSNLGALDSVALPAGVTGFGYGWLEYDTVGEMILPAGFTYWEDYPDEGVFGSNCRNISAYSVQEGNPLYFSENGSLYADRNGEIRLLRAVDGVIRSDTAVIESYAFSYNNDLTAVTIPASVKKLNRYAFSYCENLSAVTIAPAAHPLEIMLSCFQYCGALSSFSVDGSDPRFAVQDGVLYTKDMTKLVAVPFQVEELTLPATVTGFAYDGQNAYGGSGKGIRKLTVLNDAFSFGYGYYSSNSAFAMASVSNKAEIEIYGNGASTAEHFASQNGYTFISLDGVTLVDATFDLSRVPQRAIVGTDLHFYDWSITGTATYSNGTQRALSYNSGDFTIWFKSPNSTRWEENNWAPLDYEGEYQFEVRYGSIAVPFTVTVGQPDYHFEFDTSEAITEVTQYLNDSYYTNDNSILGVKLYKVFDDPEIPREEQNIFNYVNVNYGENAQWWTGLMSDEPGTYDVTFRYQNGVFTAEQTIQVTVVPGDVSLVFDYSDIPTEVEQFSAFTLDTLGLKAKLVTAGGIEYDVTGNLRFTSFEGEQNYNGIDNGMDTTVPGTKRIVAYLNLYNYRYLDDNGENQYFTVYKTLDPIYMEVTPSADYDHVRIEAPEVIEVGVYETIDFLDYVKAYKVFADGSEEAFTDTTGFRFEGISGNGSYSGKYVTLYTVGESVQYTVSFAGETAQMRVVAVCVNHTLAAYNAVPASCTADGHIAYWYCTTCGKLFADENGETEISLADTVVPAAHTLEYVPEVEAFCNAPGMQDYYHCTACGKNFWADDPGREVSDLSSLTVYTMHNTTKVTGTPATCTEPGVRDYWLCASCGNKFADSIGFEPLSDEELVIPAAHTLEAHLAKPATCKEEGNIAYWYCTACEKYFSDANAANEIAESEIAIAKLTTHTWDNGNVTKAPTCAAEGEKTFTCTVCGATRTEPVGKVGHKDADGNGYCDYNCGTYMGGETPTQPDTPSQPSGDQCKYCGETHTGFWGKIVQFFHNILYFFKNLFRR